MYFEISDFFLSPTEMQALLYSNEYSIFFDINVLLFRCREKNLGSDTHPVHDVCD